MSSVFTRLKSQVHIPYRPWSLITAFGTQRPEIKVCFLGDTPLGNGFVEKRERILGKEEVDRSILLVSSI